MLRNFYYTYFNADKKNVIIKKCLGMVNNSLGCVYWLELFFHKCKSIKK